jgi:hypothetical protein
VCWRTWVDNSKFPEGEGSENDHNAATATFSLCGRTPAQKGERLQQLRLVIKSDEFPGGGYMDEKAVTLKNRSRAGHFLKQEVKHRYQAPCGG